MTTKKFILVDTAYPINSRNKRFVDCLKNKFGDENVRYITWNRDNRKIDDNDSSNYIFCRKSPLENRIAKLKNLYSFRQFVRKSLVSFSPDVIIASHWDCLALCSSLKNTRQTLIYENLDMPAGNKVVFNILRWIERISLKNADAITYASRFYQQYYKWFCGKHFVIENKIPGNIAVPVEHTTYEDSQLTIAFNGALRYAEIFRNLFEAAGNLKDVKINIYGADGGQGDMIMKYARGKQNVTFFGPYRYEEVPDIYSKMDIVWAVYPADNFNVKNAISNKYHESVFYGVPGIFAKNTRLGEWVDKNRIGYQVDGYSVDDIRNLIIRIRDNKFSEIAEKRKNMDTLPVKEISNWEDAVSDLLDYMSEL